MKNEFRLNYQAETVDLSNDKTFNQATFENRYYRKSAKRLSIYNSIFNGAQLIRSSFVGSVFDKDTFKNVYMRGNALTYCVFSNCTFLNDESTKCSYSSNLSLSSFYNCKFKNIHIHATSFIKSRFYNCEFENCIIASTTFEDAIFYECIFTNSDLGKLNLDFSEFYDCRFPNSILPLYQFLFLIGISKEKTVAEISFRSDRHIYNGNELMENIHDITAYYRMRDEYFPLTNIYLISKEIGKAKKSLLEGIEHYLLLHDFRMIRHLCRLGKHMNILDKQSIKNILKKLDGFLLYQKNDINEMSSYIMNIAELRELLLDYKGQNCYLTIDIETNIASNKVNELTRLLHEINQVVDNHNPVSSNVEIRHNSPFEICLMVIGGLADLVFITSELIRLGVFIYKKINRQKNNTTPPQNNTININENNIGNTYINNIINIYCDEHLEEGEYYSMRDDIKSITQKFVSKDGINITKITKL